MMSLLDIDLGDVVPNKKGGRVAGEPKEVMPVFDEYKEKAIALLTLSIKEAKGRFQDNTPRSEYSPSGNWRIVGQRNPGGEESVMISFKVGGRNKLKCFPVVKTDADGNVQVESETGAPELKIKSAAVVKNLKNLKKLAEEMTRDNPLGKMFHEEAIALGMKARAKAIEAGKVYYDKKEDKFLAK